MCLLGLQCPDIITTQRLLPKVPTAPSKDIRPPSVTSVESWDLADTAVRGGAALGPLYTDEVTLSAEHVALPRETNKLRRLRTSWTLSTKEDTSSTNTIHRTSEEWPHL